MEHGELTFYLEDEDGAVHRRLAAAGAVVHIPAGRAHTIRNESDDEARAFVAFVPGTAIEDFVRAASALAAPPNIEDVLALAERHGIEMAGPLPAYA